MSRKNSQERMTVNILAATQALSMSGSVLVTTVVALVGATLTDNPAMITLPLALSALATMAATIPASLLMGRVGRRLGFSIGQAIGIVFALLCAYAIEQKSFWLFTMGAAGIGIHNAFWQYLRFAASEVVGDQLKARRFPMSWLAV